MFHCCWCPVSHNAGQIIGADPDSVAQKKKGMLFSEIECLVFSYRSIAKIDSLKGLDSLTKLQLDNNFITQIGNIAHLVRCPC